MARAPRKIKPPITKRVHFYESPKYKRTACGKLKEPLVGSMNVDLVTCESCLAAIDFITDNRKGPVGKRSNYKVATYTDFGEPGRVHEIGRHFTISSAMRQYARIWEIYGRKDDGAKVWQKMISPAK